MKFSAFLGLCLLTVAVGCADNGTSPPAEAPASPPDGVEVIAAAALATFARDPGIEVTVGVLDSGRTSHSAIVNVVKPGSAPRFFQFARTGSKWTVGAELTQQFAGAIDSLVALDTYSPVIADYRRSFQPWMRYAVFYVQPLQAGYFVSHFSVGSVEVVALQWHGDNHIWGGNTLYQFQYDHFDFGNTTAQCAFSGSSFSRLEFATTNGSCNATWFDTRYSVVRIRDETPVQAAIDGFASVPSYGTYTWTANASGGNASYSYAWARSSDGGTSWSTVCGNSAQCALTMASTTPSFRLRAQVTSLMHTDDLGGYAPSTVTTTKDVTVEAPPMLAFIDGPRTVKQFFLCTWTGSVANGSPPYTFQWSGPFPGSSSTVRGKLSQSGELRLRVTDASGRVASAVAWIDVTNTGGCGP